MTFVAMSIKQYTAKWLLMLQLRLSDQSLVVFKKKF